MVDTMHDYTPIDGGVVESFIKSGEAKNYPKAKDGAWLIAIKPDDMTKMKVKSGEYRGISLSGTAMPDNEKRKQAESPTARIIKNSSTARIIRSARIILDA